MGSRYVQTVTMPTADFVTTTTPPSASGYTVDSTLLNGKNGFMGSTSISRKISKRNLMRSSEYRNNVSYTGCSGSWESHIADSLIHPDYQITMTTNTNAG